MKMLYAIFRQSSAIVVIAFLVACSQDDSPAKVLPSKESIATTSTDNLRPVEPQGQSATPERPDISEQSKIIKSHDDETVPMADPESDETATSELEIGEASVPTGPQQHVVKGVVTQWSPMILFVRPGDQIVFKGMIGHDSQTIDGMIPDGAQGAGNEAWLFVDEVVVR